jgi:hypothetical protein
MTDTGWEAVRIANEIEAVCNGNETAAVYLALGMVIGARATNAEFPDFDGLIAVLRKVAKGEFDRRMAEAGRSAVQ